MPRRDILGRVVVITGGAGGIGQALARRFGQAQARVALLDLDAAGAQQAAATLEAEGIEAVGLTCDVTDLAACEGAMQQVSERFGGIDVLVNNAGAVHRSGFVDTAVGVFRRVMEVNYFGALHCTKAALPTLEARRGLVVVISSVAGIAPLLGRSGYAASKYALHGLFESARPELAQRGIEVLLVCPSFTRSGFEAAALGADGHPASRPRTKLGREAPPASVAEAVFAAVRAHRRLCIPHRMGKVAYVASRVAPALYERLMVRALHQELEALEGTRSG